MEHRKDKNNKNNNKHNKNDGAGSRYMERLQSELFRKVQKYWKGSRMARKAQEGPERAVKGWKGQGKVGKGRERNFCLEIHQQGFMSVTDITT